MKLGANRFVINRLILVCWAIVLASVVVACGTASTQSDRAPTATETVSTDICDHGDAEACKWTGRELYEEASDDSEFALALDHSRASCELGEPEACIDAANRYRFGEGAVADDEAALAYYRRSCEFDYRRGCRLKERFDAIRSCGDDHSNCMTEFNEPASVTCPEERGVILEPISIPPDTWEQRRWADVDELRELRTSEDEPLETCQDFAYERVAGLRCASGRPALEDNAALAGQTRLGNAGPEGRCDNIVDVYDVPCPEGNYEVHVDWYFCPDQ